MQIASKIKNKQPFVSGILMKVLKNQELVNKTMEIKKKQEFFGKLGGGEEIKQFVKAKKEAIKSNYNQ